MHLEPFQGSFLLETNVYLGYTCNFGGHRGFRIKMTPKRNFNVRNGFFVLQLVGLEVLHESLRTLVKIQEFHKSKMAAGRHLELQKSLHLER